MSMSTFLKIPLPPRLLHKGRRERLLAWKTNFFFCVYDYARLVIESLRELEGERRCWHQVGVVLAEKKVSEVVPILTLNRDQVGFCFLFFFLYCCLLSVEPLGVIFLTLYDLALLILN